MAPVRNGRWIYKEIPKAYPQPGKTYAYDDSQTIDLDSIALNGGFLVKTLVVSLDPYMRGRMRDPATKSYMEPLEIGAVIDNYGVVRVIRSESEAFKPGDHLYGEFKFQEYDVLHDPKLFRILKNEGRLPWSVYVGVAGMPGKTAYYGWTRLSRAKKGEVAFVTAAAGPVGATVVQLAKADGLKVIASAGSDDKVDFVKSVGADVAFNYKKTKTADVLKKEGPIDLYWDGVGGETLETALDNVNRFARFIECGMIADYNGEPYHVKNLLEIIRLELTITGFMVTTYEKYDDEFYKTMPGRIARGEIKYREHLTRGLEQAGEAFVDMLKGNNMGKAVVVIADD